MTQKTSHVIIYSHGFGVRKTDRGLFTAISDAIPGAKSVMFDYNPINEESNTLTVKPLNEQALKLKKVINAARLDYPGATLDLICHSQGCIVAGLVKPRGIRKIILLTPPDDMRPPTVVEQLEARSETTIDVSARTRLVRSDGSTTVIHPEYWQSLVDIEAVKLYNRLARFTQLRIINARQDGVLGSVHFNSLDSKISFVTLDGNHNFDEPEARKRLIYILQKELNIIQ